MLSISLLLVLYVGHAETVIGLLGAVLGPLAGTLAYQAAHGAPYAVSAVMILIAALWPATRLKAD